MPYFLFLAIKYDLVCLKGFNNGEFIALYLFVVSTYHHLPIIEDLILRNRLAKAHVLELTTKLHLLAEKKAMACQNTIF